MRLTARASAKKRSTRVGLCEHSADNTLIATWLPRAMNWLRSHHDGVAAPVVLASTHERALEVVPLQILQEHAVDVPPDPGALEI